MMPFRAVEKPGFLHLMKEAVPMYKVPSKIVIDRYWFFRTDTDTLYVYVPDNRYAELIFIYCYKVNK